MLLDSLKISRGREATSPTYFLYEELSHRENSQIKTNDNQWKINTHIIIQLLKNDFVVHIQCKVIMVGHTNIIYVALPGFQILLWPSRVSGLVFGCLLHIYKSVENIAIKHTCTNTIINAF